MLLCGLAGDAEAGADLRPGVAVVAQALDGFGYGGVDSSAGPSISARASTSPRRPAAVGAQDTPDEGAVLVVLDLPTRTF